MEDAERAREIHDLTICAEPLSRSYDVAMLDLDGVVYVGAVAVPRAVEALASARDAGMRLAFVTNNASRTPKTVADGLRVLGVPAEVTDVVTSAQAAARIVSTMVPAAASVLVVGGEGLESALAEHGLHPVRSLEDRPAALVQGFDPAVSWEHLAEGSYAAASGIPWVSANPDVTIPTSRGIAPGNGALVAAVASASGRTPVVAGKPEPPLFDETVRRVGGSHPLVVGDRLDTDIEGANAVGVDSLLVMTGVTGLRELVHAPPWLRPTYVGADLDALHEPQGVVEADHGVRRCEGMLARADGGRITPERVAASPSGEATALLRAAVSLGWDLAAGTEAGRSAGEFDVDAVTRYLDGLVR